MQTRGDVSNKIWSEFQRSTKAILHSPQLKFQQDQVTFHMFEAGEQNYKLFTKFIQLKSTLSSLYF